MLERFSKLMSVNQSCAVSRNILRKCAFDQWCPMIVLWCAMVITGAQWFLLAFLVAFDGCTTANHCFQFHLKVSRLLLYWVAHCCCTFLEVLKVSNSCRVCALMISKWYGSIFRTGAPTNCMAQSGVEDYLSGSEAGLTISTALTVSGCASCI